MRGNPAPRRAERCAQITRTGCCCCARRQDKLHEAVLRGMQHSAISVPSLSLGKNDEQGALSTSLDKSAVLQNFFARASFSLLEEVHGFRGLYRGQHTLAVIITQFCSLLRRRRRHFSLARRTTKENPLPVAKCPSSRQGRSHSSFNRASSLSCGSPTEEGIPPSEEDLSHVPFHYTRPGGNVHTHTR